MISKDSEHICRRCQIIFSAVVSRGRYLCFKGISHLTSDVVWLETETVSLPDGTVENVLVPKVAAT